MKLAFVDSETTGLRADLGAQAYEFAYAINDGPTHTLHTPHNLHGSDVRALDVGRYFERGFRPFEAHRGPSEAWRIAIEEFRDAYLVGSNPAFDQSFMLQIFGVQVWKHRLIDVAQGAMWVFGWDEPRGLDAVTRVLWDLGHTDIPAPDHTAAGDVETTRAVYTALVVEREKLDA